MEFSPVRVDFRGLEKLQWLRRAPVIPARHSIKRALILFDAIKPERRDLAGRLQTIRRLPEHQEVLCRKRRY
jgi:hypothetical protein